MSKRAKNVTVLTWDRNKKGGKDGGGVNLKNTNGGMKFAHPTNTLLRTAVGLRSNDITHYCTIMLNEHNTTYTHNWGGIGGGGAVILGSEVRWFDL